MKRILLIGAGFLQQYVIKRAKELGYYTLALDGDPYAVGAKFADEYSAIDITDETACLAYSREHSIDGVMTAATDYGVLTAACISNEMGLPGIPVDCARLVKNKYQVYKKICEANADDIDSVYEIDKIEKAVMLKNSLKYPVMVKPCDGSGSRGTSMAVDSSAFERACIDAINSSKTRTAVVTPYISGVEYGVESIVIAGQPYVLSVMKKWMTQPPYYAELGHAIPSGLSCEVEARVVASVKKAIIALGITSGAVNMDIIVSDDGGIHIIDVGARMGGNLIGSHIVPAGTGYDYMANLIRQAVGDPVETPCEYSGSCVATRLLALRPGVIQAMPSMEAIESRYNVQIEHHLHVGDVITPYRTNLDGCGYIISTGHESCDCIDRASNALRDVDDQIKRA